MQGRPIHLRRLTTLRAGAALLVFGNHLSLRGGDVGVFHYFFDYGYTGVAFFFVLSGFVLSWSSRPGDTLWAFYIRRFARIYPSHLAMLFVAVAVPVTIETVTLPRAIVNGALLQSWFPGRASPYTLNGVSWSLSCEVAFYAILPLVLPWARGRRPLYRWLFAALYWAAGSVVTICVVAAGQSGDGAYVYPPLRLGEFLLGVVAALELQEGRRLSIRAATGIGLLGIVVMAASWRRFPVADVGAVLLFLAVVILIAQRDLDLPRGFLTRGWLVYAGRVSFAFYLVHELVIINLAAATGLKGWPLDPVAFAASCIAAVALHHGVERPFERRLRSLKLPGHHGRVAEQAVPLSG